MTSGIYKITSPSGRFYIGSAIDIGRRWSRHRKDLRAGKHGNINLMRAARKYGQHMMDFSVLLICSPERLIDYEQACIDGLKPAYNIAPRASSSKGIKRSAEFRAKISAAVKGRVVSQETRDKIGARHKGKKLTPEHIKRWHAGPKVPIEAKRLQAAAMHTPTAKAKKAAAMVGHATSDETKKKISLALKGRQHSPERRAAIIAGKRRAAITLQNGA